MAKKHILSLNIVDGCNPTNFSIIDTTSYASAPISCPTLAITPPGSGTHYYSQGTTPDPAASTTDEYHLLPAYGYDQNPMIPYTGVPAFNITVDNILLGVQSSGDTLSNLADGLWTISYCVAPCDKLGVEYYYLRTVLAQHQYAGLMCKLRLSDCLPDKETEKSMLELRTIKMYLDAAKYKVEVCHAPDEGVAMYEYALKLMANWEKACCSTC